MHWKIAMKRMVFSSGTKMGYNSMRDAEMRGEVFEYLKRR